MREKMTRQEKTIVAVIAAAISLVMGLIIMSAPDYPTGYDSRPDDLGLIGD